MLPVNEQFCMWNVCDLAGEDRRDACMELLHRAKTEQVDFLREVLHQFAQALMELEITQHLPGFAL